MKTLLTALSPKVVLAALILAGTIGSVTIIPSAQAQVGSSCCSGCGRCWSGFRDGNANKNICSTCGCSRSAHWR